MEANKTVQHGSASTYTNHACRCQECRTAYAAHKRAYQAAIRRDAKLFRAMQQEAASAA